MSDLDEYSRQLLRDLRALEIMIDSGMIESGVKRIGAEQELYIVDNSLRPKAVVDEVLRRLDDPHFTVEIAKFNIEINLDPLPFDGGCLSGLERNTENLISKLNGVLRGMDLESIMAGILPTIKKSDLEAKNLTAGDRYIELCENLNSERQKPFEFRIRGTDELIESHDTPMFESCNTSFQVHLQVNPEEAVRLYNLAQVLSAPVLACAVNSPLLLGKRLWNETRIALFQQAVDTRVSSQALRQKSARVTFGMEWISDSVLEIYHDNIARFSVILGPETNEDSLAVLEDGGIPKLHALELFNTTVWRWNRVCYGVTEGKPHLRIENRVLPSGPTVTDEIANTALWLGLMSGMPEVYPDVTKLIEFDDAKGNFIKSARTGLDSKLKWMNGGEFSADELILNELLPVSRSGLRNAGIIDEDADHYLDIIEERVRSGKTGARWILGSFSGLRKEVKDPEALLAVTAGMMRRQKRGDPVHMWKNAGLEEAGNWFDRCEYIEQVMTTDLFVIRENDLIDLAAGIMSWKHIRHVPVEDDEGRFRGLLTSGAVLSFYGSKLGEDPAPVRVKDIMIKDPLIVSPETKTLDAVKLMFEHKVGCLPVLKGGRLVGIVTEHDFMNLSAFLLKHHVDHNSETD